MKERSFHAAAQVLVDVFGKNPQTVMVPVEEIETDNWGLGGETITARRKKAP